ALLILMIPLLASCDWQVPVTFYTSTLAPTLDPINLAGPEMQVGSLYPYANDTLLVAVPAGEFSMGHGGQDNPVHQIWLADFWLFRTKVSNAQYARCVNTGYCAPPDSQDNPLYEDNSHADDPVVGVTYDQASAYCAFMQARLPSEAEWEKAARGPHGNLYPWGSGAPSCDLLNFNNCVGTTTNVTSYPHGQSYYSALDMEGNAFEWTADWYEPLYYRDAPVANPAGPDSGQQRSVRSSSYKSDSSQVTAATRFFDLPENHRADLGFRCVVTEPTRLAPSCKQDKTFTSASTECLPGSTFDAVNHCCTVPSVVLNTPGPSPTASLTALPSTLLSTSSTPASLPTLINTILPISTIIPATLPISVPTVSLPKPTLPLPKPTLAPAPLPTKPDVVCQPLVCILPKIFDALKCKCVLP
ncbi:MAG TPA: SUMF1/EgtB/PvdO family nonheme iron enzyme, partial [Anaerolineales bacterium]|nr:SUMF1/EgtB/PvdO family nonheme iron enzyme [Anaerolineales bacterium]